jgi:hypothetical protein
MNKVAVIKFLAFGIGNTKFPVCLTIKLVCADEVGSRR